MTKHILKEIYLTDGQVKKLRKPLPKQRPVSLKIKYGDKGTLTKLMSTKQQVDKYNRGKPFVLNLSTAQITAMLKQGGFFGPALSVMATTLIPKILPVLGTLGLAAASGTVSGTIKKAVSGDGIQKTV